MVDLQSLSRQLEERAPAWYPGRAAAPTARFVRSFVRASNSLLRFDLAFAAEIHPVAVKIYAARPDEGSKPFPFWPRLEPSPGLEDSPPAELEALTAIRSHFDAIDDPSLGSIRALGVLPDRRALVVELAPGVTLGSLACRLGPVPSPSRRATVERAFRNSGRWLRRFHSMPVNGRSAPYRCGRGDLIVTIRELAAFLVDAGHRPSFARDAAARAEDLALAVLPERPEIGLGHGDFWPGNVIVDAGGRVTVIDTYARWSIPIYEDIAYFLAHLKSAPCQLGTAGYWIRPAVMRSMETAFLEGYFGVGQVPRDAIRPFEALALLNTWAIRAHNADRAGGATRASRRAKLWVRERFLRGLLGETLARVTETWHAPCF